jgi:hypothetical protein
MRIRVTHAHAVLGCSRPVRAVPSLRKADRASMRVGSVSGAREAGGSCRRTMETQRRSFDGFQKRKDTGVWEDVKTMLGKMRSLNQGFAQGLALRIRESSSACSAE